MMTLCFVNQPQGWKRVLVVAGDQVVINDGSILDEDGIVVAYLDRSASSWWALSCDATNARASRRYPHLEITQGEPDA